MSYLWLGVCVCARVCMHTHACKCVAMEINSRALSMPDECFTSPCFFFMLFILDIYVLLCMCQCGPHGIHVEVRGEAVGVGSPHPCELQVKCCYRPSLWPTWLQDFGVPVQWSFHGHSCFGYVSSTTVIKRSSWGRDAIGGRDVTKCC